MNLQTKHNIGDIVYVIKYTRYTRINKCNVCNGKGKIELKSKLYTCPECLGYGETHRCATPQWKVVFSGKIECIQYNYVKNGSNNSVSSELYQIRIIESYESTSWSVWVDSKNCFDSLSEAEEKCKYNNDYLIKG